MQYERAFEIQRRLEAVLRLIEEGRYSTPALAEKLGVSIPTISRCVQALRERGYVIRSEKHGNNWRYLLQSSLRQKKQRGVAQPAQAAI